LKGIFANDSQETQENDAIENLVKQLYNLCGDAQCVRCTSHIIYNVALIVFWRSARDEFPLLASFAKDIISIPMGCTEVECMFSMTRNFCQFRRHSLSTEIIHDVMIFKHFLRPLSLEDESRLSGSTRTIRSTI
jgi:hypothetical protein